MAQSADFYADLSEEETAAAAGAANLQERIAHLENALRFALVACAERGREAGVIRLHARKPDWSAIEQRVDPKP